MANGPLTEANKPNKKPDWEDILYTKTAYQTPVLSMMRRTKKPIAVNASWPVMNEMNEEFDGILDGTDVSEYSHQARSSLKSVCQWVRSSWKVTKIAQYTESYGVKDEVVEQKAAALRRLKTKIERLFLSNQDANFEGEGLPNRTRGLFKWCSALEGDFNSEYPVPAAFRTAAGAIYSSALADFGPGDMNTLLMAIAGQVESSETLDLFCSMNVKSAMSGWGMYDPDAASTDVPLNRFIANAGDKAFLRQIDIFKFDAGTVRAHVSYNLFRDPATGEKTGYSDYSGLLLDMQKLKIAFMQEVAPVALPDLGGGPRGAYDAITILKNLMPCSHGKILCSDGA